MASKLETPNNLITSRYFKIHIDDDPPESRMTALDAFGKLIYLTHEERSPVFASTARGYRPTLRPASIDLHDFIHRKMIRSSPNRPIQCIRDINGWIFFGAI